MLKKTIATVMLTALASGQAAAVDLYAFDSANAGARRSGAVAGAYLRVPLGSARQARSTPVAGLRLGLRHDYRQASAPRARGGSAELFAARGAKGNAWARTSS